MGPSLRSALLPPLAAAACLSWGCILDAGPFQAEGNGASAGSNNGGAGNGAAGSGTAGSGTAGSGAAGSAGSGTAGSGTAGTSSTTTDPPECMIASDCPAASDTCHVATCAAGKCGIEAGNAGAICNFMPPLCQELGRCDSSGTCVLAPSPKDTILVDMSPGDCQKSVCDGNGGVTAATDDSDIPSAKKCSMPACSDGAPVHTPIDEGKGCGFAVKCCGGACCIPDLCIDGACCDPLKACGDVCCPGSQICLFGACAF